MGVGREARVSAPPVIDAAQRLDKWLWFARFFKVRGEAAAFIAAGRVRLAHPGGAPQRVQKASQTVRPGDVLTFVLSGRVRVLRIEAAGQRRGPAQEARLLYAELSEAVPAAAGEL